MGRKRDATGIVVGGEPRIDFLPAEVKVRKQARKIFRSLVILVFAVVVLCVGGYVYATTLSVQSQLKLAEEQERTQQLLKEQAEYAEVQTVSNLLAAATDARLVGSATEIFWQKYLGKLQSALPSGVSAESYTVDSQTALELTPVPIVPLQSDRVATITFTATVPGLPQADALLVNLRALPGFADSRATTIGRKEDGRYSVMVILNINSDAFERRFFEAPETDVGADGAPAEDSTEEPTEGEG